MLDKASVDQKQNQEQNVVVKPGPIIRKNTTFIVQGEYNDDEDEDDE